MHIAQRICLNMVTYILSRPVLCGQQTSVLSLDAYFRSNESEFSHDPVHPAVHGPCPLSPAADMQSDCFQSYFRSRTEHETAELAALQQTGCEFDPRRGTSRT